MARNSKCNCQYPNKGGYKGTGSFYAGFGRNQADTADTIISVIGVSPVVSKTIEQFRTLAQARGMGWEQIDIQIYSTIQLLYLVEYADTDCQAAIGRGRVDTGSKMNTGGVTALTEYRGWQKGQAVK